MSTPTPEAAQFAEESAVRAAVERGYLQEEQLREALLLREQLKEAGRPATLLKILGARFLKSEHQTALSKVYFDAINEAQAGQEEQASPSSTEASLPVHPPAPIPAHPDMMMSSVDELAIPEFLLSQSQVMARRPPSEDPDVVKEFIRRSTGGQRTYSLDDLDLDDAPAKQVGPDPEPKAKKKKERNPETSASGLFSWFRRKKS